MNSMFYSCFCKTLYNEEFSILMANLILQKNQNSSFHTINICQELAMKFPTYQKLTQHILAKAPNLIPIGLLN